MQGTANIFKMQYVANTGSMIQYKYQRILRILKGALNGYFFIINIISIMQSFHYLRIMIQVV